MTQAKPQIIGGFGGGQQLAGIAQQQARKPTIANDTLQSKAFARVLDAISEGEIEGLVDGDKSIFLDDTPIRNASGALNFLGVTTYTRTGTQAQSVIEGFPSVENEKSVGVTIEAQNNLAGTWEREWFDATFTRSGSTLTITAPSHGLSNGDSIFLNFEDYNSPYDRSYTVANAATNTFDVTRYDSNFVRTSGTVYVMRPRLKINATATASWTAGSYVFLRFLRASSDPDRTNSTLYNSTGTYNGAYEILSSPSPTSTYFYINWVDKAGALSNAAVDGGSVLVTGATYTKSSNTITVSRNSHGLTVGMDVELKFLNGVMNGERRVYTVVTATTNSFTVTETRSGFGNTGAGTYYVDVPITAGAATRTITDRDVDRVRIKISVPALQRSTDEGDVLGSSFRYAVDIQLNGGGFNEVEARLIKGKTSGGYTFDREFTLKNVTGWTTPVSNNFPIDIRVRRVNEDASIQTTQNAFSWQSYTEITDAKLRYPNTALVGLEVNAEQFNSVPKRSYLIKGIKVRIPSNATVDSATGRLIYSGTWDGTFGAAQWCSCPAWILWDLLTSRRYGFGEQILTASEKSSFDGNASRLDKWSFYSASQYANQLVDTGLNNPTQESRFSCNVNIQGSEEAFTLVNELLSVFRSQAYWSNGSVTVAQDRPQDASYLFGSSNVINGDFTYSGSDIKTRPTIVLVRYFNLDTRDTATEVVEDADLIAKYGIVKKEVDAFACTSQSQAARVGRWLLYTDNYETETVSFSIGIDSGVVLRPGMIIKINDQTRAATRLSGRISAGSTTTTVVIDADRTVTAGDDLAVVLPNGLVETRNVSGYNSSTRTITVDSAFSVAPQQNGVWLLTTSTVAPSTWRVVSVGEDSEQGIYGVTALSYNPSKFAYIESGAALQTSNITALNFAPNAPNNFSSSENLYADNNVVFVKVSVGWDPVENAVSYRVRYRVGDNNWVNIADTESPQVDIFNAQEGSYEMEVYAINAAGKLSVPSQVVFTVLGKTAPPANLLGLDISQLDDKTAELSWPIATDLDVLIGGKVIIRHTPSTGAVEWQDTNDIIPAVSGNQTNAQVPLLPGTYMAKFEDSSGNRSASPLSVQVVLPQPQSPLTVVTFNEDTTTPPFQGNGTNLFYSDDQDGLILDQGLFIDALAVDGDFDSLSSIDAVGDIVASGEYEFGSTLDLGGVFDVDLTARFVTRAFLPGDLWDDKIDSIDVWPDIDGSTLDRVNATLYVRTTDNDPTGTDPVYGEWQPVVNGARQGRGFQFKVVATSTDVSQNIVIDELGATVTLQKRQENANNVSSGAGSYVVTFTDPFYATPSIGISGQNMVTGDYYVLSSISRTGFTVTFRNSAGTAVSRTFDWQAVGHGRQVN